MRPHILAEIQKEVYNRIYGGDGTVNVPKDFQALFNLYDNKKAIAEYFDRPAEFVSSQERPALVGKTAREIALESSVALTQAYFELRGKYGTGTKEVPSECVALAEEIYQWLIKEDKNG